MHTFAKAQTASLVATTFDHGTTVFCVEMLGFLNVVASGIGTIIGGIINFSLSREWVFPASEAERRIQMFRYFIVWLGYLALTTSGVYVLTQIGGFNYIIAKLCVTLFLAIAYNYPLQKRFVFR